MKNLPHFSHYAKETDMETDGARIRRCEDNLNICGIGVIIMGAWSILKVIIELLLESKDIINVDIVPQVETPLEVVLAYVFVLLTVLFLCFLIFCLHLYIGLNAVREAKGNPYKKGYYVWTLITLVLAVAGIIAYKDNFRDIENIDTTIAAFLVDITFIYILVGIVVYRNRIRKLRAQNNQEK